MWRIVLFFLLLYQIGNSQLQFTELTTNLGNIAEAAEIKGDVIIKNTSDKKIYLMRADAENGVKVYVTKKTLLANDTCLMIISFVPERNGKFTKKINLVASNTTKPYELSISGTLLNFKPDNKQACFYFGSRKPTTIAPTDIPIVVQQEDKPKDNSNKIPDPVPSPKPDKPKEIVKPKPTNTVSEYFSRENYKPNNLIFLVDVSSSMRDSLKLPLMKNALHILIDKVRDVDSITFITYASKVTVLSEAVSGADKKKLHTLVDSLKAKGMTSGNKAILLSQQIGQKHFIAAGNNQIFLATDGEFKFAKEDYQKWKENQKDKKIIVSTIAFGDDKDALKNLKQIAEKGEGSFIPIKSKNGSSDKLLNEIKLRSRTN
ncbi:MAG: VWA domain-containing protein [Bacteroidia bacterium]|nr:VWA domain-containing protein [Bacteroidia bacterium]